MLSFLKKVYPIVFDSFKHTIESIQISYPEIILSNKKIRDASIMNYIYPHDFPLIFRRIRCFPERYCFLLSEGIIIKNKGLIITKDRQILLESYGSYNKLLNWDDVRLYLTKKVDYINNNKIKYFLPFKSYYHFLMEEIPALLYAKENFKLDEVYINNQKHPKLLFDILVLITKDTKISVLKKNTLVHNLVFTQRYNFSGGTHISDIELLNKYLLILKTKNNSSYRRIYISRKNSLKRKIFNENEIESYLDLIGFSIIYAENYSIIDQIKIFSSADFIISPHGAGLSNIIWNPNHKKKIIEIFPTYVRNDCFASIAVTLNYYYDYIFCKKIRNKEICIIDTLSEKIKEAEKNVQHER